MNRLGHALRRAKGKGIAYVGGYKTSRGGSTGGYTQTFIPLLGGIDTGPRAGDLVIVTVVVGSQGRNPTLHITAPTTYSRLTQLNASTDLYDTSLQVSYKFMSTTDFHTYFTLPSTGNVDDSECCTVQVFRGVDQSSPFDVTSVSATGINTGRPNPGPITPITPGAWVVICGGGSAATGAIYTAPTNFTDGFLTRTQVDVNDSMVGSGYWSGWASGAVDPAAYTGGSTSTDGSWAAYTIALRPA